MLVTATPPETRDEQMHQLVQAQRLGLLLGGHNCHVYERAVGSDNNPQFRCAICHSARPVKYSFEFGVWLGHYKRLDVAEAA